MTSLAFTPASIAPAWNAFQSALPVKIGVFLLAGGWHLVVSSLVRSF